jgi:hypothetical protein
VGIRGASRWYSAAIMPDLSFSPIGDTAAVAALLWTVWRERESKKALAARTLSTVQKKSLVRYRQGLC